MIELSDLRRTIARLEALEVELTSMPAERRIRSLAEAAATLRDPERETGRAIRNELERTSGLSSEGVAFALDSTLASITEASLRETLASAERAAGSARVMPRGLAVVVLSGNVSTAPLTALTLPLLFGNPTLAKASSRDEVTPMALIAALFVVDPQLAEALAVVAFPGGDREREDVLLAHADAMVVYGSDATVNALRTRTPPNTSFVAHGHGLGVAFVGRQTLGDPSLRAQALRGLALDVAAYDQRGCLSPHVVAVEGDETASRAFAVELAESAMVEIERRLPRGALPGTSVAPQMAWRSVGIARGELFEGRAHAVSLEADGPMRASPGHRNVQVVKVRDVADFVTQVRPFGVHLKQVGVACDPLTLARLANALTPPLAPRFVPIGQMQTPAFGGIWDGELSFTGLVRYAARP